MIKIIQTILSILQAILLVILFFFGITLIIGGMNAIIDKKVQEQVNIKLK